MILQNRPAGDGRTLPGVRNFPARPLALCLLDVRTLTVLPPGVARREARDRDTGCGLEGTLILLGCPSVGQLIRRFVDVPATWKST
jgi:hypothetical protein